MKDSPEIFSTILASTVHDMKNSLGMLSGSIEAITEQFPQTKDSSHYAVVKYEASRVNNALMQLLALYKMENNQLPFNPSYYNVYDFIEEQVISHEPLLNAKGFDFSFDVDENIEAVFDETLLSMAVSNVIGNAIRYAHSQIQISAKIDGLLKITICDDGPGYPAPMLELAGDYIQGINQSSGSTGLGLFFSKKVAALHHHGGQIGHISLENGGALGGGVFQIIIP